MIKRRILQNIALKVVESDTPLDEDVYSVLTRAGLTVGVDYLEWPLSRSDFSSDCFYLVCFQCETKINQVTQLLFKNGVSRSQILVPRIDKLQDTFYSYDVYLGPVRVLKTKNLLLSLEQLVSNYFEELFRGICPGGQKKYHYVHRLLGYLTADIEFRRKVYISIAGGDGVGREAEYGRTLMQVSTHLEENDVGLHSINLALKDCPPLMQLAIRSGAVDLLEEIESEGKSAA